MGDSLLAWVGGSEMLQRKKSKLGQAISAWRFCFYVMTLLMLVGVTFMAIELEGFTQRCGRRRRRGGQRVSVRRA